MRRDEKGSILQGGRLYALLSELIMYMTKLKWTDLVFGIFPRSRQNQLVYMVRPSCVKDRVFLTIYL